MDLGVVLIATFDFLALLLSFFLLCIVCDEHLVPAVEVFIVQFQVPEEVAAVTLVAFGSAAPELFLNSVSAVVQTSDLSLAAILGSGIIAFGLIPPLCILSSNQPRVQLHLYPIIRESGFYMIGLFVFLWSINDGRIGSSEALLIVFVYVCYTCTVAVMYYRSKAENAAEEARHLAEEQQTCEKAASPHMPHPASPIRRSTSGGRVSPSASDDGNQGRLRALSADPACEFFPTLNRQHNSSTDSTRTRRGKNAQSGLSSSGSNGNLSPLSPARGTSPREQGGTPLPPIVQSNDALDEYASLISDDIEAIHGNFATDNSVQANDSSAHSNAHTTAFGHLVKVFLCIYSPIQHLARGLLPALHPQIPHFISGNVPSVTTCSTKVPLKRAILVLLSSILAIGVLAVSIVVFCESVIGKLGFSSTAMGATLVALGAEIPDTVSAVALARNGYVNAAVAGAIGSQVINVSLGVGVPALLVGLFGDGYLRVTGAQAESLTLLTCLLIIVILSYTTVTVPIGKMILNGTWSNNTIVTKPGAMFQIGIWLLTYVTFLHLNKPEEPI